MSIPDRPRAVVTGGGSGLGRAFCLELAKRGARVLVADIREDSARDTAAMLPDGHAIACDVARAEEVEKVAARADELFGGVDVVINNAGVAVAGAVGEIPLDDWRWIVGVNLWGVVHGCHVFVPRLRRQGRGHILNVASAAGLLSAPMMSAYNVTKAGVVSLSETLAAELDGTGVGVSVLCPTFFRTNILSNGRGKDDKMQAAVERMMDRASVQAEDVARIALESADRGDLYVLPHPDGRWFWRLKRAAPERYRELAPRIVKWGLKRFGVAS